MADPNHPVNLTGTPTWTADAACRNWEPSWFTTDTPDINMRLLCASCPVQTACRNHTIRNNVNGYAAGTTQQERNQPTVSHQTAA